MGQVKEIARQKIADKPRHDKLAYLNKPDMKDKVNTTPNRNRIYDATVQITTRGISRLTLQHIKNIIYKNTIEFGTVEPHPGPEIDNLNPERPETEAETTQLNNLPNEGGGETHEHGEDLWRMITWNLRNIWDLDEDAIINLVQRMKSNILFMQETHLKQKHEGGPSLNGRMPAGWKSRWSSSATGKGGVGIAMRNSMWNDLVCEKFETPEHLAGYYIKLSIRTRKNKWVHIYNIYLPPSDRVQRKRIWTRLRREIENANGKGEIVFIGGDLNGVPFEHLRNTVMRGRDTELQNEIEKNGLHWLQTDTDTVTWRKNRRSDSQTGRIDGWLSIEPSSATLSGVEKRLTGRTSSGC